MAKRYTIKEIQRLTRLSPTTIKEFLNVYRRHLAPDGGHDGSGELTLDQDGFDRLLFLKQLALHLRLSQQEVAQQIGGVAPRGFQANESQPAVTAASVALPAPASVDADDGQAANDPWSTLSGGVGRLQDEVKALGTTLQELLSRYTRVLGDLQAVSAENRQLRSEIVQLKRNQASIVAELRISDALDATTQSAAGRTVN